MTVYTFRWAKINLFLFVIIEQTDNNRRPGNRRLKGSLPKRFGQITRQIPVVFFLKDLGGRGKDLIFFPDDIQAGFQCGRKGAEA